MRWIFAFTFAFFVGLASAGPCDDALENGPRTFAIRNPTDAAVAYARLRTPGGQIGGAMGEPIETGWAVAIEIDEHVETFEVVENDDNTCTVRFLARD